MAVSQNACEFSQRCCSQAVNHRVFSRLDVTLWNRRLSKYQFRSKSGGLDSRSRDENDGIDGSGGFVRWSLRTRLIGTISVAVTLVSVLRNVLKVFSRSYLWPLYVQLQLIISIWIVFFSVYVSHSRIEKEYNTSSHWNRRHWSRVL